MKMNNLNNPSRVILSNPARVILSTPSRVILSNFSRVILSVAKDLAVAFALFAFVACSDYLADFQDKYDDGDAFAEISSDSDNGSDKIESSNSTDSSATDPGSSSSVAESSSSTFEPCTGTVIYDYKNPGKLGLNLQFLQNATTTKLPENGQGIELSSNTVQDYAIFALSENDLHDVSSWEGLCVEYSSNEDITLYLADLLKNMEQINLPANDHFKEISWADTTSRKISIKSGGRGRVSFNKFDLFSFGISTTQKVTISRITTIAKVDPGSSSSVAESSSAKKSCDGTVIYEPNMSNKFGEGFKSIDKLSWNTQPVVDMDDGFSIDSKHSYELRFNTQNIYDWEGLCIEYTTEETFSFTIKKDISSEAEQHYAMYQTMEPGNHAVIELPWNDDSWKYFTQDRNYSIVESIPQKSDILGGADLIAIGEDSSTRQGIIHKITTLNPVKFPEN